MVLPCLQLIFPFIFLVCSKQGLVAEAEAVLQFDIFWFNLLIWSHSIGVRVEARSTLRNYGWSCESHEVNEEQRDDNKDEEDNDSRPSNIEHFFSPAWTIEPLGKFGLKQKNIFTFFCFH